MQAAKARAEHRERKATSQGPNAVTACVSPVLVDQLMREEKWWTFSELAERFRLSHDKISRDFKGRDGIARFGSDYRVSEAAVKSWLADALLKGAAAA
jgi:hypothetical protein